MDKCSEFIKHEDCVNCSEYKENKCSHNFCTTCGYNIASFASYCNACLRSKLTSGVRSFVYEED